ncbi:MAG: phosphoglycerate dehydrogenase [Hyphomicrobiaceae bacterium]
MSNPTQPRVLVSDALSETAVDIFRREGLDVVFEPDLGKDKDRLHAMIPEFDGLAVRSATKVTEKLLASAPRLKVIGRAGIGVDNVDVKSATARGIVVMNTPHGNSVTTAEHAIALMFALARQIPAADTSTQAGKWEKARFMGVELTGKTLGIIGCGNIGSIVATRGVGLRMRVIGYDPFLTPERALELGVEKVELAELLARSDFITLHTPLIEQTRNILSAAALARTKRGVRIINCARGGLIDEQALADAIVAGHVAGAAIDVFAVEPATSNVLFGLPNVVCTPHLGASTDEAQENVALQIAEQMSAFLLKGAITNAINFPNISAEEAPRLKPFVKLAENLGLFAGQLTADTITAVRLEYAGDVADMNTKALTAAAIAGVLRPVVSDAVNMISAPSFARDRGLDIEEVTLGDEAGAYQTYMRLTVRTPSIERSVAGTVFSDGKPRIIQVKGIDMEAEFTRHMLYVTNEDKPGFIGRFGALMGENGVNIARLNLGRDREGGNAILLVAIDQAIDDRVLSDIGKLPLVRGANRLAF